MKAKTLQVVWHSKDPVFSVDFHPDGFFATGGADLEVKVSACLPSDAALWKQASTVLMLQVRSRKSDFVLYKSQLARPSTVWHGSITRTRISHLHGVSSGSWHVTLTATPALVTCQAYLRTHARSIVCAFPREVGGQWHGQLAASAPSAH